jgi:hypothetical protein
MPFASGQHTCHSAQKVPWVVLEKLALLSSSFLLCRHTSVAHCAEISLADLYHHHLVRNKLERSFVWSRHESAPLVCHRWANLLSADNTRHVWDHVKIDLEEYQKAGK